jgi:tungstate transport system substrate-binding protein
MDRRRYLQAVGLGTALSVSGCLGDGRDGSVDSVSGPLTVATATTINDSGLLKDLTPGFETAFGMSVRAVVRGTGAALRTARDGNCDAVLVHARPLEDDFLRDGHGVNRRAVAVNDFLVVGPPNDPAGAAGRDPVAAFNAIAASEATFLSRGDRSGTHVRERRIWEAAGRSLSGDWYRETGQGMGNTLVTADEMGAYTLVDRGTFLNVDPDDLAAHVSRGVENPPPLLRNEYAVIPTNPTRHNTAYALAMAFVGYLTGPGQQHVESFRVDGEQAFRSLTDAELTSVDQYGPSE